MGAVDNFGYIQDMTEAEDGIGDIAVNIAGNVEVVGVEEDNPGIVGTAEEDTDDMGTEEVGGTADMGCEGFVDIVHTEHVPQQGMADMMLEGIEDWEMYSKLVVEEAQEVPSFEKTLKCLEHSFADGEGMDC